MEQNRSYSVTAKLDRTRYYMGGYWTFLATAADTNGQFSLMEVNLRKGLEPPAHTHTFEDESFHVIEGAMAFTVNGVEQILGAGEFIHLPKGVHHSFRVISDTARALIHLVPAGLEQMFLELSQPATEMDFPPLPPGPPTAEWLQKAAGLQQRLGIMNFDNSKVKTS